MPERLDLAVGGGAIDHSTPPNVDPAGVERLGLKERIGARLRGQQTLAQLRRQGLRAQPHVRLSAGSVIDPQFPWAVEIGAYTVIAHDVRIIAHDAAVKRLTGYTEVRPVRIGAGCYIGAGTLVLPGANIGDGVVIGAGALVRGAIEKHSVAVGRPARIVASTEQLKQRHLARIAVGPRVERFARELDASEIPRLQNELATNGRLYVL